MELQSIFSLFQHESESIPLHGNIKQNIFYKTFNIFFIKLHKTFLMNYWPGLMIRATPIQELGLSYGKKTVLIRVPDADASFIGRPVGKFFLKRSVQKKKILGKNKNFLKSYKKTSTNILLIRII